MIRDEGPIVEQAAIGIYLPPIIANTSGTSVDLLISGGVSPLVETLYLQKSVPPGNPPIGNIAPAGILNGLTITKNSPLTESFSTPGLYDSWFRQTNPGDGTNGAYSYHVIPSMPGRIVSPAQALRLLTCSPHEP